MSAQILDLELIGKLIAAKENAAAVMMTPEKHRTIIAELFSHGVYDVEIDKVYGLPILFDVNAKNGCSVIDQKEYNSRKKVYELLKLYKNKIVEYKTINISSDKICNFEVVSQSLLLQLSELSSRITKIEQNLKLMD
ncbi:hypothetical protein [Acinetobacter ursingii]|uniref:hypothetical protein n=1 Tax=Acinetobacter ursingii TaxID=108980 RepID=UPI00124FCC5C|nr:hypothetical protein [Acinetobacter ursingii]